MTDERRMKNVIDITETLWTLNKPKVLDQLKSLNGGYAVPDDCVKLIEYSFRTGAVYMERTIGRRK